MKQAVILAAGEGQRLRPFTVNRPKAMISIADRPILHFIIDSLARLGIRDLIFVVGYRKEQVYDYLGAGEKFGVKITYVTQENQLGTAHALYHVKDLVADEFLVLPGDNLIEAGTIADFVEMSAPAVLVKRVKSPSTYGVVDMENGEVRKITEKPREAGSNLVNTGVYVFDKDIFKYVESVLDVPDALNSMIADGYVIKAHETAGTWLDVAYPWDIISLNHAILQNLEAGQGGNIEAGAIIKGKVSIGEDTIIRSGTVVYGPAVIGSGCEIGPQACVMPSTSIGDNVTLAAFSQIKNCVIGNDVTIGPGSIISDSIIDKGCVIKGRFTALSGPTADLRVNDVTPSINVGVIMGEGCKIDANVTAQPGAVVGNGCQVQLSRTLSGRLPDKSLVY